MFPKIKLRKEKLKRRKLKKNQSNLLTEKRLIVHEHLPYDKLSFRIDINFLRISTKILRLHLK